MVQKGGELANVNASCGSPDTDHGKFVNESDISSSCFLKGKTQLIFFARSVIIQSKQ